MTDDDARPAERPPHAYERACRNTQHPGCTCMVVVDGRWCGKPRNDPIHTAAATSVDDDTRAPSAGPEGRA